MPKQQTPERQPESVTTATELEVFTQMAAALGRLDSGTRERVLRTVATFFQIEPLVQVPTAGVSNKASQPSPGLSQFSEDRSPSPKEFLLQKRPQTDIDRIACLAYYLTHYREQRHFKTLDLSKLNTDAAQIKFSNASLAVENATKAGYLVPAIKGMKQISATGEIYVEALPDRVAARDAARAIRPKRQKRKQSARAQDNDSVSDGS